MGRKRISEYAAKKTIFSSLGWEYSGISITPNFPFSSQLKDISGQNTYVVKVDQGVKKRFKNGLISLNTQKEKIEDTLKDLSKKGYSRFIIEPFLKYDSSSERYLALERSREGIIVYFSKKGGVDIESHQEEVYTQIYIKKTAKKITELLGISEDLLYNLINCFNNNYFSFLEINPLVVKDNTVYFLDVACEVDSAAEFFVENRWTSEDYVEGINKQLTKEEVEIEELAANSQASFTFKLLNPNGSIFVLLSGGGASVVVADEVYSKGFAKALANYGEYSGNPNAEETYLYTKSLLQSVLKSTGKKKVIIIGGGVANFTDIRITFKGIIQAMSEVSESLRKQQVKIFVRRGGPYQEEGLDMMREFLNKEGLYGEVKGPDMILTDIVEKALDYLHR